MRTLTKAANHTRHSPSIPAKLVRTGALHLLPVYYLLRLSDLGREGIEHSGSFRFADHIYRGLPSGRTPIGRWLDTRLLAMPAARAFRQRYERAAQLITSTALNHPGTGRLRVLAVPCGLPRDVVDAASALARVDPEAARRIEYHGLDIDPEVIAQARRLTFGRGLGATHFHVGNALNGRHYPSGPFDLVISTGLGDFLTEPELQLFYRLVYRVLAPHGIFYTSASNRDPRSDRLLQMAELTAHYRSASDLERILCGLAWTRLDIVEDQSGLQTFATANR